MEPKPCFSNKRNYPCPKPLFQFPLKLYRSLSRVLSSVISSLLGPKFSNIFLISWQCLNQPLRVAMHSPANIGKGLNSL